MDAQRRAWLQRGKKKIKSKGNSGKKVMVAEYISIWGKGFLCMTDEEYAAARRDGYTGPQRTRVLMEIGDEDPDSEVTAAQIAAISGDDGTSYMTPEERVDVKVDGLYKKGLVAALSKYNVPYATSGVEAKKAGLQAALKAGLRTNAAGFIDFLSDTTLDSKQVFLKGYFRNEHVVAQAIGKMRLTDWLTKTGVLPGFVHEDMYDNAPSHHKRKDNALNIDAIKQKDGYVGAARRATMYPVGHAKAGLEQLLVLPDPAGGGGFINKGVMRLGFERGYWREDGRLAEGGKVITLDVMRDRLRKDDDFAYCPTIVEDAYGSFEPSLAPAEEGAGGGAGLGAGGKDGGAPRVCYFAMTYLPKFWCSLAW